MPDFVTAEELLASARSLIVRLTPREASAATQNGAILVDIRPTEQRDRDGFLAAAYVIPRNVLEWRLDPHGEHRDPRVARLDRLVILICDEGYQSSLAAANLRQLGLDAADVIGGVQAWRREEMELRHHEAEHVGLGMGRPRRLSAQGSSVTSERFAGHLLNR